MPAMTKTGRAAMERKTISISGKRQITIPQSYYERLGFGREAECILNGSELIIRPVRQSGGEFAEQILRDLVSQGLSGEGLISAFCQRQAKIRPAVEVLIAEADAVATGSRETVPFDALFSGEE